MATHSSILAWRIPWTEKPGGLQSMGLERVGHDRVTNIHTHTCSLKLDMFLLRNTKLNLHYIQDFQTWETPEFCKIRIFKSGPGSKLLKLPMWFSGSVRFGIYCINKCWQGSQARRPLSRPQDVCTRRLSNLTLSPGSMGTLRLCISCRLHQSSLSLMETADLTRMLTQHRESIPSNAQPAQKSWILRNVVTTNSALVGLRTFWGSVIQLTESSLSDSA